MTYSGIKIVTSIIWTMYQPLLPIYHLEWTHLKRYSIFKRHFNVISLINISNERRFLNKKVLTKAISKWRRRKVITLVLSFSFKVEPWHCNTNYHKIEDVLPSSDIAFPFKNILIVYLPVSFHTKIAMVNRYLSATSFYFCRQWACNKT